MQGPGRVGPLLPRRNPASHLHKSVEMGDA